MAPTDLSVPGVNWAVYAHPIFGTLLVLAVLFLGSLGLRSRSWPRRRAELLRQHAALGPWVYCGVLLAQASGLVSVYVARGDLTPATSVHFRTGGLLTLCMLVLFASRAKMHLRWVRTLHPWIGAVAMLVAAGHVFFGLQLTR